MLLLEQDTTKKEQINELFSKSKPEFDADNNKEYKVEAIINNAVYAKKAEEHLLNFYYFVSWKGYLEEKSTWESFFAIIHFWKMISLFHKDHLEKPMAISPLFNFAPPMTKPLVKPAKLFVKQKQDRLTSSTKTAKEWDIGQWGFFFPILVRLEDFFTNSVSFERDVH